MRVLCTRPNASELINNVRFERTPKGMLSEDIPLEVAQAFASIDGYTIQAEPPKRGRPSKSDES